MCVSEDGHRRICAWVSSACMHFKIVLVWGMESL
jgi:hypothetical protein